MPWIKRALRGQKLYVEVDEAGKILVEDGRVFAVYQLAPAARIYRPYLKNLQSTGEPAEDPPVEDERGHSFYEEQGSSCAPGSLAKVPDNIAGSLANAPDNAISIYTDGACIGNPGPMGLGAVIIDGKARSELSEYLGMGTNNIAELTAILRALQALPPVAKDRSIYVYSDSSYALGLLSKGWKAKANPELVAELRGVASGFPALHCVKVKGHAGIPENERCDTLARQAIREHQESGAKR